MTPGGGPPPSVSVMDAIRAVWDDEDRNTNLLFALLLMVIPLVGPIVMAGWFCEFHQRLVRRHPKPLPKFDFADFGHYLPRGLAPFVAQIAIVFPLMIFGYVLGILAFIAVGAVGAALESTALIVGGQLVLAFGILGVLLVVGVFLNAAMTRAELTEDVGRALELGELWAYSRATWPIALWKMLSLGVVGLGLGIVGLLACFVGIYAVSALLQIASVHLRWQIYERYLAKGGPPIELEPVQQLPSEGRPAVQYGGGYAGF